MRLYLKDLRKAKRLTQGQLADAVGATKRQIGAWERGENDLPLDYACAIADVLECTLDEIAGTEKQSNDVFLLNDERRLLAMYRSMSPDYRAMLMKTAVAYCNESEKDRAGSIADVAGIGAVR